MSPSETEATLFRTFHDPKKLENQINFQLSFSRVASLRFCADPSCAYLQFPNAPKSELSLSSKRTRPERLADSFPAISPPDRGRDGHLGVTVSSSSCGFVIFFFFRWVRYGLWWNIERARICRRLQFSEVSKVTSDPETPSV